MRFLRNLVLGIIGLAIILVAVAFVLPRTVSVERITQINAPAEEIFPFVNSMQKTEAWSPWLAIDPDVALTYEGPEAGVGNKLSWTSQHPDVRTGSQIITASTENALVETALDFGPMGTAEAYFKLAAAGEATDVTWGFTTDLGMNPIARWMGLMIEGQLGADYETGLANLKSVVEGG